MAGWVKREEKGEDKYRRGEERRERRGEERRERRGEAQSTETHKNTLYIRSAGALPWKRFAGITTDGAPSMTGRKNELVALLQRKLEEEGVEEAFALHCIFHQQALCSKCLKFDSVMSDVVKFINHIISRGIKHCQFRSFLEEIESAYEDVLYFTEMELIDLQCNSEVKAKFREDVQAGVPFWEHLYV
ncbi:hypothetical protein D4764_06G0007860 [Takifugu flavidus]|uniref:General transcription factor II-I repeat domain-containing protein 2A n=1 Tax=Takifugu flavidus TaxID=433684 RepID=A0A5C6MW12_9TELE|nr:hypothetical protein D4764_06G0007860 [Takifugu flavidus]